MKATFHESATLLQALSIFTLQSSPGVFMKSAVVQTITLCVASIISVSAFAQTAASDDIASSAPVSAPVSAPPSSAKARRAQNHLLQKKVRHALTATKGLNSSGMSVLAKDGVVSLVGSMPDDKQISRAVAVAQSTAGVQRVDNRLKVFQPGN
ncbi:BON domain-containing protein [Paraburkholderia xenovorans]|uniref:BON domain-containing protein n=1 Tax=Paraburkholderia xenovorans TaxID=36873 RepID=UPI0034585C2C